MVAVLVLLKLIFFCAVYVVVSDDDMHSFWYFDVLNNSAFDSHSNNRHWPITDYGRMALSNSVISPWTSLVWRMTSAGLRE